MHLVLLKLELVLQSDLRELPVLLQHFAQLVVTVLFVPVQQVLVELELLEQPVLQREPLVLLQQVQLVQEFLA
jgi:hypothetical protein